MSRLKGDLRLGLPAVLTASGQAAIVAWVEQIDEERFAALASLGRPELAVTRHRAGALGRAPLPPGEVLRIAIPADADLALLRAMAGTGPRAAPPDHEGPAATPGTGLDRAATALAGAAQVLPAALVVPLQGDGVEAARRGLTVMEAEEVLELLQGSHSQTCVSSAHLPMDAVETGRVHVFRPGDGAVEHTAIEIGRPDLSRPVTVRLHSACFTGDVLGSLKCDCGPQLRAAMSEMAASQGGVVLYLNQEGRGIGLANKMRAYALQEAGLDTVEANNWLGFDDDLRDFRVGALMLQRLGISRVRLMTNNPAKVRILAGHGIEVVERVPLEVGRTEQNARYLATKAAKSGHLLT